MPHSLRVRLKNLQRKGELTEKDIDRIFKALEQEQKVTTTSTDEPMVMQYPQVDGITPTVVKAEQEPTDNMPCITPEEMQKCKDIVKKYTPKQKPIEKITLLGCEQFVSPETYQQVCRERDIAVEQLHDLGYELGQKIEPCDDKCHYCEHDFTPYQGNTGEFTEQEPSEDAVSRQAVISVINILADKMNESGKTTAEQFISVIKDMR